MSYTSTTVRIVLLSTFLIQGANFCCGQDEAARIIAARLPLLERLSCRASLMRNPASLVREFRALTWLDLTGLLLEPQALRQVCSPFGHTIQSFEYREKSRKIFVLAGAAGPSGARVGLGGRASAGQ